MSEGKVFEGKTTNEAIENGLKALGIKKEDAEIKVLENEDKRSFFSIFFHRNGIARDKNRTRNKIPDCHERKTRRPGRSCGNRYLQNQPEKLLRK